MKACSGLNPSGGIPRLAHGHAHRDCAQARHPLGPSRPSPWECSIGEGTLPLSQNTPKRRFVSVAPLRGQCRAHRIELTDCPQAAQLALRRKSFTRESLRRTGRACLQASSATGTAQAPSWLGKASLRPVGNRLYRVSCSHIHSASARLRSMAVCFARLPSHLWMSECLAVFLNAAWHATALEGFQFRGVANPS
jgi:hypothetical protein